MNKSIMCSMVVLWSFGSLAQSTNRYMVFFKNKEHTPYTINEPEKYLSPKAILRKGRIITSEDLPVTPAYILRLKDNNALVIGTTKWFNGALIELHKVYLPAINALPFVKKVVYVGPGKKPSGEGRQSFENIETSERGSNTVFAQDKMLNSDVMHADGYYGKGRLIAIFDSGFSEVNRIAYFSHLYDRRQIVDIHNFVTNETDVYNYNDHGTRVFSTMAASGVDYEGIAPQANYLLYVTEDRSSEYKIEEYNWLLAAERADSIGVDIITTSLGYFDFDDTTMNYSHSDLDGKTAVITKAAEKAFERGIVVIANAGNEGHKAWQKVIPPADGEHVLAIGSVDENQVKSLFSSTGPIIAGWIKPDLMAMGERTRSIARSGSVTPANGTSFACPQVAGLVAGIWEKYPELSNVKLIYFLRKSAHKADRPDNEYGYGIASYTAFSNYYENKSPAELFNIFPNPVTGNSLSIEAEYPNTTGNFLDLVIYTTEGKKIMEVSRSVSRKNNLLEISLNHLSKGVYIMKIITSEQVVTKPIVKQ